jgi:hypothetical protein
MHSRAFETRSRPPLSRRYPRGFAFYVAFPKSSIRPLGSPIYVARVPVAPSSLLPSSLYFRCLARRSLGEGGSLIPFAPFGRCNGERTNVRCARSRSQSLTLQAACVAGKTSHSDVATAIGRTQKGVRRFLGNGNDPPPLCYGAASSRRRFQRRRLGGVGD